MNMKTILLLLLAATTALHAAVSPGVKWHPGHYVYVGSSQLTDEVLTLPHFRGVQKAYAWRQFEPKEGRYDFSALKADLLLAKKHGRQLVVQFTFKSFTKGKRSVPDYLTGEKYGGGVYLTVKGGYNPVLWNRNVAARFDAMLAAFGREFDGDPNLEAVNLPETAPNARLKTTPQAGVEPYSDEIYFAALKQQMATLRRVFPRTVVIQYTNFPANLLEELTDYQKEIGMGMGGPDVYPRQDPINDPKTGIYRLYPKLAGTVPLGAAVQSSDWSVAARKRNAAGRGQTTYNGVPIRVEPADEVPIPPREHLQLAQQKLKLNYLFWNATPADRLESVKKLLAEPDLAGDPAGGLVTKLPIKAFLR